MQSPDSNLPKLPILPPEPRGFASVPPFGCCRIIFQNTGESKIINLEQKGNKSLSEILSQACTDRGFSIDSCSILDQSGNTVEAETKCSQIKTGSLFTLVHSGVSLSRISSYSSTDSLSERESESEHPRREKDSFGKKSLVRTTSSKLELAKLLKLLNFTQSVSTKKEIIQNFINSSNRDHISLFFITYQQFMTSEEVIVMIKAFFDSAALHASRLRCIEMIYVWIYLNPDDFSRAYLSPIFRRLIASISDWAPTPNLLQPHIDKIDVAIQALRLDKPYPMDYCETIGEAIVENNIELLKPFLVSPIVGQFVNLENSTGYTALYSAARRGHPDIVLELLKCPFININVQNKDGSTPLHVAGFFQHAEVIAILLSRGADFNLQNKLGLSARQAAQSTPVGHVYDLFLDGQKPISNYFPKAEPYKPLQFSEISKNDFCEQISYFHWKHWNLISRSEICSFAKPDPSQPWNSVQNFVNHFNQLSLWIQELILTTIIQKQRYRLIKNFISIAQKLYQMKNLNGVFCIVSALHSIPVFRLKSSWGSLKDSAAWTSLFELTNPGRNYAEYRRVSFELPNLSTCPSSPDASSSLSRESIHSSSESRVSLKRTKARMKPHDPSLYEEVQIPHLAVLLSDVVHLQDAIPSPPGDTVNYSKFLHLSLIIENFFPKKKSVHIRPLNDIQYFIQRMVAPIDNSCFMELSLWLEPKKGTTRHVIPEKLIPFIKSLPSLEVEKGLFNHHTVSSSPQTSHRSSTPEEMSPIEHRLKLEDMVAQQQNEITELRDANLKLQNELALQNKKIEGIEHRLEEFAQFFQNLQSSK